MARINERQSVKPFEGEDDLRAYIRTVRKQFNEVYSRDVAGYFIRKLAQKCGLPVGISESTLAKMNFAFALMNKSENYRSNKSDLTRALEIEFKEKTLGYIVDDFWDEWHAREGNPKPSEDIDCHGQGSLF